MNKVAIFISRHEPSKEQIELARKGEYDLVHVGDLNAFDPDLPKKIWDLCTPKGASAVCCVHPQIASASLGQGLNLLVFENINRAQVGEPPKFEVGQLIISWIGTSSVQQYDVEYGERRVIK